MMVKNKKEISNMKLSKDILIRHLAITFLVLIAVVVLLWVVCKVFGCADLVDKDSTLIIAFFGILATFIVVSNYAQMESIKMRTSEQIDDIKIEMDKTIRSVGLGQKDLRNQFYKQMQQIRNIQRISIFWGEDIKVVLKIVNELSKKPFIKCKISCLPNINSTSQEDVEQDAIIIWQNHALKVLNLEGEDIALETITKYEKENVFKPESLAFAVENFMDLVNKKMVDNYE